MGINEKDIYQYVPELKEAWVSRKIKEGFFNGNQAVHVMQDRKAKKYIESLIKGKEPFLCARWGAIEGKIVYRNKIGILREQDKEEGCNNAGIFPITDEVIAEYIKITEKAAKKIDVLCMGVWVPQLEELYRIYSPKAVPVSSMVLEICQDSVMLWTKALERMRVLVIHPFSALIRQQYKKRKYLFSKLGEDILPEMELITYQAVQSIGGTTEYMSWVSALEKMEKDISKIEFDIALIGCGSYGLPLGAYIKEKLNKKAIHVGGVLQLFFGIKGKRWDERGYDTWLYNEHWVRPTKDLRPLNYKNVENGCYW